MLIEANATIDLLDNSGLSPLIMSTYNGHFDVVVVLVINETDLSHIAYGKTALEWAKYKSHDDIVEFLTNYTIIHAEDEVTIREV